MYCKKECIAMLLAGGQGSSLYDLTKQTAKPAVTFAGKYKIIDFPLSNCVNSGIDTVGVLTQYQPLLLVSVLTAICDIQGLFFPHRLTDCHHRLLSYQQSSFVFQLWL